MTKLNDASPGEWSMSHKKSMEERREGATYTEQTVEGMIRDNEMARRLVDNVRLKEYVGKLKEDPSALDTQVGGEWYLNCAIQPIEFIMKNDLGFCEGNAIKYICRHEQKGGALDIDKAIHYLEMLKEDLYS
tara:strand:+ start:157 stop:552 length:396 start_codon:yes stop_codon:yes gene_type:complete